MTHRFWSALARHAREVIAAVVLGLARPTQHHERGEATVGMRVTIAALVLSAAGFGAVLTREGYRGDAYPDPVKGTAVATIGFGSTQGVKMGDKTTPVAAVNRALREVQAKESAIKRCAPDVELHQHEYDAYIELAHNIGEGAFCRSQIVKSLKARDYPGACGHVLDWKYVGDVDCSKEAAKPKNLRSCGGLWDDRLRIHAKCMGQGAN